MSTIQMYFHHARILSKTSAMREINLRTDVLYAGRAQKILRAGDVHFRNNGTNAGDALVAQIRKKHGLIKRSAYLVCAIAIPPQSHASLDSPLARIGAAQQCIAGNASIIRTVNTPLYTQLGSNFDCIHEHLEQAMQEIIAWRDELYLRHPELPYPEFDAFLIESGNSVANLSAQPLTRVLINVAANDVEINVEHLYIVKNYTPFNLVNYVNLKTIAMFDGTMTDALRTAIQNLAKQQNTLERIIIPSWGSSISNSAFQNATSLIDLLGFSSVTILGSNCFNACSNLRTLGTTLNEINLNSTSLGSDAFNECTSILKVTLPNVSSIPDRAFKNCGALTSADCPLVTSIGFDSFYRTALENCKFGLLTFLGQGAFLGTKLVSLSGLALITSLRPWCFNLCFNLCTLGDILNEVNLNITTMEYDAFKDCSSLVKVTLPNLTNMPYEAFIGCTALTSINCPLVTTIGRDAFNNCSSLSLCNFGQLTSIGSNAFKGCTALNPIPSVG